MSDRPIRILLIEPEEVLAEITSFRLELLGYEVETVGDPEGALRAVDRKRPDIFIIDLNLPGSVGMKFLEQLTCTPATNGIPILALSFEADIESVQNAHANGAADFLVAPYFPATLEEKVARLVKRVTEPPMAPVEAPVRS